MRTSPQLVVDVAGRASYPARRFGSLERSRAMDARAEAAAAAGLAHAEVRRFLEGAEGTQEVRALLRHTQAQAVNSVPSVFMDDRLVHGGIDAVQELIINGEGK